MSLPDGLTVARAASVPFVVLLYAWNFDGHNYWATGLFAASGCDGDKPAAIATGLVEADLLGHTTHGLQLAPVYLGELLASRGFILVSVDENFINGNLRGESDGRAWLLLKHIEDWKRWNDSSAGPFASLPATPSSIGAKSSVPAIKSTRA